MTATDLLAALEARSVRLWLAEEPAGLRPLLSGTLTPADRALVQAHRAELHELVLARQRAATADGPGLDPCWQDRPPPASLPLTPAEQAELTALLAGRDAALHLWAGRERRLLQALRKPVDTV